MFLRFNNLYSPEDSGGGSTSDTIELLNEIPDETEEKLDLKPEEKKEEVPLEAKKEGEKEEEEKPSIEEELEDELEEPTEEDLEFTTPARRSEILKAYPDLFKKFPQLEKAYYREQEFSKEFPTLKDAHEAKDKASTLDLMERDVANGDLENILKATVGAGSFEKTIDGLFDTIYKINQPAYFHMAGNIIKHTIYSMVKSAESSKNDELRKAALEVNKYVFHSEDYEAPKKLAKEEPKNTNDDKLAQERAEFEEQRFETANDNLNTRVNSIVRSTIMKYIDPRESMTSYVRDTATEKCLDSISEQIDNDRRFGTVIQKLWEDSKGKNYSSDSVKRIENAFRSKIQTLLPSAIKKARQDALKGMGRQVRDEKEETTRTSSIKNTSPKESRSHSNEDGPKPGESSYEYLQRTLS